MANKIYQEKQRFHDWFILVLLVLATAGLLYGASSYFWRPETDIVYSIASLLLALGLGYAIYWLTSLRYKLTITDEKIKLKIKGPIASSKKIAWDDIESCTIVKTPSLTKFDRPKVTMTDEKFYSLDGRNGLMIKTKDGSHYFIGVQDVDELKAALNSEEEIWEVIAND
ncbi:hypothetical protein FUA23_16095 [Neolewinella aurantiaca]|uniref:PH domain-containing protein n=1 Tax=Neolewinella aurantiaca TaxID=2602767 RepID=A0A5C7FF26_9BACT|nr:hypothetical protein [Neolewinella aurantiaca]TXF88161.1 hypothetical protein FUA23_16095 [Neolewinella aurantiaca]